MRRLAVAFVALLCLTTSSWSAGVELRHKLRPGETLTYTVELSGNGTIAAMGMTQPMVTKGSLVYTQRVTGVDPQGNIELRVTCTEPKIAAKWGDEVLPIRLTVPPIIVTMTPTGQIVSSKVEQVPDQEAQQEAEPLDLDESLLLLGPLLEQFGLGGGNPTMMSPGGDFLDTSKLFGTLRSPGFPTEPVDVGSQWHEIVKMELERSTPMETKCDSTLLALQPVNGETVATIRASYETPLDIPLEDRVGLFTLSGSDKGTVTSEFSVDRGRVLKSVGQTTSTMKMEAAQAVGLLGIPVSVSMTSTTKYEVTLK